MAQQQDWDISVCYNTDFFGHSGMSHLIWPFLDSSGMRWIELDPIYEWMEGHGRHVGCRRLRTKNPDSSSSTYTTSAYVVFIYSPLTLYAVNKEVEFRAAAVHVPTVEGNRRNGQPLVGPLELSQGRGGIACRRQNGNKAPATILIVDDEPSNVEILCQELDEEGYELVTAGDGEQAMIKVNEHQPDLILLDVMMPKVDGFTVCRILKGSGRTVLIPIILLTSLRSHEDRVRGIEAGADDFISKPFEPDELLAKIRSLLRLKAHRDQQAGLLQQELESARKDLEQSRLELAQAQKRIEMLERAKNQLCKFVPGTVRRMAETDPETFGLQKVETDATVLFLDIGGYSVMCESLGHEKVNFLVEKYFSEFIDDVRKGNGEINETSGDGLMILFHGATPKSMPTPRCPRLSPSITRPSK